MNAVITKAVKENEELEIAAVNIMGSFVTDLTRLLDSVWFPQMDFDNISGAALSRVAHDEDYSVMHQVNEIPLNHHKRLR